MRYSMKNPRIMHINNNYRIPHMNSEYLIIINRQSAVSSYGNFGWFACSIPSAVVDKTTFKAIAI